MRRGRERHVSRRDNVPIAQCAVAGIFSLVYKPIIAPNSGEPEDERHGHEPE